MPRYKIEDNGSHPDSSMDSSNHETNQPRTSHSSVSFFVWLHYSCRWRESPYKAKSLLCTVAGKVALKYSAPKLVKKLKKKDTDIVEGMVISHRERVLTSKERTKPKSLEVEVGGVCSLQETTLKQIIDPVKQNSQTKAVFYCVMLIST